MKIHVTGAHGYLGQHISENLQRSHAVTMSDVTGDSYNNLSNTDELDVVDKDAVIKQFRSDKPDVVIHLAGLMGAQKSKTDLHKLFSVNTIGTLNVLEAAHLAGTKNIIFFSSQTVHGSHDNNQLNRWEETDSFTPEHPYATSKVLSEYIIREYCKHNQMRAVILRPAIVVGNLEGEPNALNEFTENAYRDEPIVIYGKGDHRRQYISVGDLIRAVDEAIWYLEGSDKSSLCEPFLIAANDISMSELAERSGGTVEYVEKTGQAFSLTSVSDKANKVLGWTALDNIEDMIKQVRSQLDNQ